MIFFVTLLKQALYKIMPRDLDEFLDDNVGQTAETRPPFIAASPLGSKDDDESEDEVEDNLVCADAHEDADESDDDDEEDAGYIDSWTGWCPTSWGL